MSPNCNVEFAIFRIMTNEKIIHRGIVERIEKNKIFVRIEQKAACSECHAASACFVADKKDKIFEVIDNSGNYALQEDVLVSAESTAGRFAIVVAYALPLLAVIISVIAGIYLSKSEIIGGVTGLLVLGAYYLVLYLLRDRIKRNLLFTLSKASD